jgi:hypothetical protein
MLAQRGHLEAMLDRLTRTGLYQTIVGAFIDYTGGRGYLTAYFEAFLVAFDLVESDGRLKTTT